MKKILKWRYYCEFCKKSGCAAGHMAKHERHCCRNPSRVCRMCIAAGDVEQQSMLTLRSALLNGGLAELTDVAQHCPACILAALIQDRMTNPITFDKDHAPSREFIEFDYKAASKSFWEDVNRQRENYGS